MGSEMCIRDSLCPKRCYSEVRSPQALASLKPSSSGRESYETLNSGCARALTVKCGTGTEMKGTVRGRKVTWGFEKTGMPPMTEDRVVVTYTAEVSESGTELKGTWRLTSGVSDEKGNVEAKKK